MKNRDPITITFVRHNHFRFGIKGPAGSKTAELKGTFKKSFATIDEMVKYVCDGRDSVLVVNFKGLNKDQYRAFNHKIRYLLDKKSK